MKNIDLINKLNTEKNLAAGEWHQLLSTFTDEDRQAAADLARSIAQSKFGKNIYIRGIVEFSNYCKNDCYYCGIRLSNKNVVRYRLNLDEILECCEDGYKYGFRTIVLQGGEDPYFNDDRMVEIVATIRERYHDCAITLSLGERSEESYRRLFDAGADRYLLRHETADCHHYGRLHPDNMSWQNRMDCLRQLKAIGYQTGCGLMVGSPFQTVECLVKDLQFIHDFRPHMIGMGPFIPHKDTPFAHYDTGSVELNLFLISLCRIMQPDLLLPATTALGAARGDGRQQGVLAGANVIMPNLSPINARKKYMLYDNKPANDCGAAENLRDLQQMMAEIGYQVEIGRGDYKDSCSDE